MTRDPAVIEEIIRSLCKRLDKEDWVVRAPREWRESARLVLTFPRLLLHLSCQISTLSLQFHDYPSIIPLFLTSRLLGPSYWTKKGGVEDSHGFPSHLPRG